ncbi:MAG: DinB family protein [Acidobacteriota bacterium]
MSNNHEPVGRPDRSEAAPYFFGYIDRVHGDRPLATLKEQMPATLAFLSHISEDRSLHRYAEGKWNVKQVLNHISDCERLFTFRAFWFARGFTDALPAFDQDVAASHAPGSELSWSDLVEDFRTVRMSTLSLFENLLAEAWMRKGEASGFPFTVRAVAFINAGHLAHHTAVISERYLQAGQT